MHLTFVHELEQSGHVVGRSGLQDDQTRAAGRCRFEQFGKVFGAGGQNELVRFENRACVGRVIFFSVLEGLCSQNEDTCRISVG